MEIYLIRHTTPNIEKGICYGQSDLGITDSFLSEVEKIHEQLPVSNISKVYSSPLQRCKLLAETFQKPVTFDNRLKELNFGDWELQSWDTIPPYELNPWMDDFVNVQVPMGESYIQLQNRILDFYTSLPLENEDTVILVTHAGPMRALLSHIRNIALKDSFSIKIKYGEVISI